MDNQLENIIQQYQRLGYSVNKQCNKLHRLHHGYTKCRKRCDECCMNFRLLPVEFFSILNKIKDSSIQINLSENAEECPFLKDHTCQIYEFRPLICRSHGLPILTMDELGENWELSYCPLNFTDIEDEYFTQKNCFQQDVFNSKLYMINQEFIRNFKEDKFGVNDMLDLKELSSKFKKNAL